MSSSQSGQKARGNVVFRMAVASDVHISTAGDETASRLKSLFSSAYRYAESQPYGRLDAAVFVGDLTNYGREDEWRAVTKIADGAKKEETELLRRTTGGGTRRGRGQPPGGMQPRGGGGPPPGGAVQR